MEKFDPDQFDLAAAVVSVKENSTKNSFALIVRDCNSSFSSLTDLKADRQRDVSGIAFRGGCHDSLSELFRLQKQKEKGEVILPFKNTGKYLLTKISPSVSGALNIICFDYTAVQRKFNSFSLQEVGYRQYIDNFHGLAFQRMLTPKVESVFTAGAFENITGYTSDQGRDLNAWLEIVHPEDREYVRKSGEKLYDKPGFTDELEYRIIRKDGEIRWLHSYDSNFISDDGNMLMVQGLMVDITDRKELELKLQSASEKILEQNVELEKISMTDYMTGLANRRFMQQVLQFHISNFKRTGEVFSILMLDLDNFKEVNDKQGHDAGDAVICNVSDILKEKLREVDIKSRWGGEEFLILLPRTDLKQAGEIAEKLLHIVRESVVIHKKIDIKTTFSCGVSSYHRKTSLETLLREADRALYRAKKAGRNRITISD